MSVGKHDTEAEWQRNAKQWRMNVRTRPRVKSQVLTSWRIHTLWSSKRAMLATPSEETTSATLTEWYSDGANIWSICISIPHLVLHRMTWVQTLLTGYWLRSYVLLNTK